MAADVRTYPPGVTSWIDLEPIDVEAAKEFYGSLFGWTFADATPPDAPFRYVIAQLGDRDAAGIGGSARPVEPAPAGSWNTYVAVDDAAAATERVRSAGGRIVSPPAAAGEGGVSAVCKDPAGVEFRLWQANRRPGAQVANTPGAWNFSDLHSADPAGSITFYATVFGWEFDDLGFATMIRRPGYGDHLAATIDPDIHQRQASDGVPPGFADVLGGLAQVTESEVPHWHVTFTVADRDETAAAADRLGATVLASTESDWTKDALIRDPQGAEFTASQFTPPGSAAS